MTAGKGGRPHYAWVILLACCLVQFGTTGTMNYCAGVFYGPVCESLGFGRGNFVLYATIQSIVATVAMPFLNRFLRGKHIGGVMALAVALMAMTYGMMSRFTQLWQWYGAAVIYGAASSLVLFAPCPMLISRWFADKVGTAMGVQAMASGVGGAIMMQVSARVIESFGWRSAYVVQGALAAVIVIPACLFLIKSDPADQGLKPYGYEKLQAQRAAGTVQSAQGAAFADIKSGPAFFLLIAAAGLISFCSVYTQHFTGFGQSLGYPASVAATITSVLMLGSIFFKAVLGWLNDKLGVRRAVLLAEGTLVVSFLMLLFLNQYVAFLYVAAFLYGLGPAMMAVEPSLITKEAFGTKDYTRIYSYTTMGMTFCSATGLSVVGFMYDGFQSYIPTFALGIGVAALAAAASLAAVRLGRRTWAAE